MSDWNSRHSRFAGTGSEIQARINWLSAQEMRDKILALERYDNWRRTHRAQNEMNNPITIEDCHRELELEICPLCKGRRMVPVTIVDMTAYFECPRCDGTGVRPVSELIDELRKTVQ